MKKSWVYAFIFSVIITSIIFVSSVNLDINHDGVVNVQDLQLLASHYEGKATYNSTFDLNGNGKVDLFDVVAEARQVGSNLGGGNSSNNSVAHPHEPAGYTQITERNFNALNENGWTDVLTHAGTMDIYSGITGPVGGTVGRITFPAGTNAGSTIVQLYPSGVNNRKLYIQYFFMLSPGFQNEIVGTKQFFITDDSTPGGGSPFYTFIRNDWQVQFRVQGGPPGNGGNYGWNQNSQGEPNEVNVTALDATVSLGTWHEIEWLIDYGTPGNANGEVQGWLDGKEIIKYSNQSFCLNSSNGLLNSARFEPIWGGMAGDVINTTQYEYVDYIYESGKN